MRWWRVLVLPVILAGIALAATPAQAHVSLQTSSPSDGDTLSSAPERAELVFSDPLNPQLSRAVVRIDGTPTETGPPRIQGAKITLPLPGSAGRYEIIYRVIAQDGHRVDGRIRFTVVAASSPAEPSAVATPPSSWAAPSSRPGQPAAAKDAGGSEQGSSPMWWLAGLGTVLVLSSLAYVFTIGRNRDKDVSSVGTSGETDPPGGDRSAT